MQSKKKKNLIKMKGNKNLHMIIMNIEMIQKILKIKMIIMNENKIYLYLFEINAFTYIFICVIYTFRCRLKSISNSQKQIFIFQKQFLYKN